MAEEVIDAAECIPATRTHQSPLLIIPYASVVIKITMFCVLCAVCFCKLVVTILASWRYFVDPEVDGMLLRLNVWFLNNIEGYILLYNIEN